MNTTKLVALMLVLVGCDAGMETTPPVDGGSDAGVIVHGNVSGAWSFHFVPFNRVADVVPPPCDGTMNLTESGGVVLGDWACTNGSAGMVKGQRYSADSVSIGFFSTAWDSVTENWGGGIAAVTDSSMTVLWPGVSPAPILTATRAP